MYDINAVINTVLVVVSVSINYHSPIVHGVLLSSPCSAYQHTQKKRGRGELHIRRIFNLQIKRINLMYLSMFIPIDHLFLPHINKEV